MNIFDLNNLNDLEILGDLGKKLETNEEFHIAITGVIAINEKHEGVLFELLDKLAPMVPKDKWFDYFFRCYKHLKSSRKRRMIIKKAHAIIEEITSSKLAAEVFTKVEKLYVSREMSFCNRNLLKIAANKAYELARDKRYMLFRDYAYLYTTADEEQLKGAVKFLTDLLKRSICKEDQRCIFYLLVLALIRLAKLINYPVISNYIIQELHKECTNPQAKWELDPDDDEEPLRPYKEFAIVNLLSEYNCPEVTNIFNYCKGFYAGDLLKDLHEAAHQVIEDNKYSSERSPIVSQEFVFLS